MLRSNLDNVQVRTARTADDLLLTYYVWDDSAKGDRGGSQDERWLVLIGAPGMSVRFWLPLLHHLEPRRRVLAYEYRGFPGPHPALSADQASFARCVQDLELVLRTEHIQHADFVAWCGGASLLATLLEPRPELAATMCLLGIGDGLSDEGTQFDAVVLEIKQMLEAAPGSAARLLSMAKRVGVLRPDEFFEQLLPEPELRSATRDRADIPSYMLFQTPETLATYAFLFAQFRDNFKPFLTWARGPHTRHIPTLMVRWRTEGSAPGDDRLRRLSDLQAGWEITLSQTTQFPILQAAGEIAEHLTHRLLERRSDGVDALETAPNALQTAPNCQP